MSQDSPFVWKRHWKGLGWACKLGWAGSQGIHQGGANSVSQVDRESDMGPCGLCQGEVSEKKKKKKGFCQHICLGENRTPQPCPEARQFSSSPYVPGTLHTAAPVLELRASVPSRCVGPLRRTPGALSHSATISTGFHSHRLWALEPWARSSDVGLGPLVPSGGTSSVVPCLCPFYQSPCDSWWLFYSLAVILRWLWEVLSSIYLCCHLDPKAPNLTCLKLILYLAKQTSSIIFLLKFIGIKLFLIFPYIFLKYARVVMMSSLSFLILLICVFPFFFIGKVNTFQLIFSKNQLLLSFTLCLIWFVSAFYYSFFWML